MGLQAAGFHEIRRQVHQIFLSWLPLRNIPKPRASYDKQECLQTCRFYLRASRHAQRRPLKVQLHYRATFPLARVLHSPNSIPQSSQATAFTRYDTLILPFDCYQMLTAYKFSQSSRCVVVASRCELASITLEVCRIHTWNHGSNSLPTESSGPLDPG